MSFEDWGYYVVYYLVVNVWRWNSNGKKEDFGFGCLFVWCFFFK